MSELHHKIALIVKNNQTGNCIRDLSDASGGKRQTPSAVNSAVQRDHSVCVLFNLFQTNSVSEKVVTLTTRYGAPFRVNEITPRYWVSHARRVPRWQSVMHQLFCCRTKIQMNLRFHRVGLWTRNGGQFIEARWNEIFSHLISNFRKRK